MIGSTISHYRIIKQLGQGGMGVVYKAEDTRLHRPVALKFLPPQMSGDEEAKQRFMQEARAASALDHANICSIYDIGEAPVEGSDANRLFIVMAFYDGETLKYRLKDAPLPIEISRSVGAQLAAGLERAHEAGIVHRDMKPANIMVTNRGEVKILDFGVAKLAGGLELTRTGSTLGTAAYMSPEQARGEVVDYRTDLWSLGVILYEMLTGRRPFTGDYEAAVAYAILNEPHPSVGSLRPDVPEAIAQIVDRLLSKDPAARFQSAQELKEILGYGLNPSTMTGTATAPTSGWASQQTSTTAPTTATSVSPTTPTPPTTTTTPTSPTSSTSQSTGATSTTPTTPTNPTTTTPASPTTPPTTPTADAASIQPSAKSAWQTIRWVGAALVIVFAIVVAIALWPGSEEDPPAAATGTQQPAEPRAIAVLPFTDVSPNRDSEYMSDGIAEELIYALSKLQNLAVAARTSSFYFKGRNEDVKSIAQQLNVDLVLNGSVRRDGEALRVTAELVNAADGFQLWSERYDRRVDDVFALQEDITRSIVEALEIELTGAEATRLNERGTESVEAYTSYLHGRQQWNLRTRQGLRNAIELLEQAIEYDPNYARAHAGLADAYIIAADWGYMPGRVAQDQARTATRQALALDPDLPEGYVALAAIEGWYKYDFDYAIAMFEKALELDPRYATGHQWFGQVLAAVGRCEEATDHLERALELDPLSPIINSSQTLPYFCLRDYDEAERLASRALGLFPQFDLNRVYLSLAYMGKGDLVSAKNAVANCELGDCIALHGMINAMRGQTEEAMEALRDPAVTGRESQEPVFQAWIYIGLGDFDAALDRLYEAIPQGNSYLIFVKHWSLYDPLRDDPRFDQLISDLGLDGSG